MSGYTTGSANELTSDGVWNYAFDKNGNVISKTNISTGEVFNYGYDNKNRLVSAKDTTTGGVQMRATYVYDALGQRLEKDVWTQSSRSTTTTRFAYDRSEIWADLNASNALQTRYVRGDRVLELLARIVSGTAAWFLADRMGSVRNVVDNTGAIIDTITYDGYGNIVNESNPANGGQYKYDGYRYDSETGLYYLLLRYYDIVTGRWFSQDLIGLSADDINLYMYTYNNSTNHLDPSGSTSVCCLREEPPERSRPIDTSKWKQVKEECCKLKKKIECKGLTPEPMPTRKTKPEILGLTYCEKDAGVAIKVYPPKGGIGDPSRDDCFRACIYQHEEYHRKMIDMCCPEICKCYPDNTFDIGYGGDPITERIWECPAYIAGLYCLQQMIEEIEAEAEKKKAKKHPTCSRAVLRNALAQLKKQARKICNKDLPEPITLPKLECRKK
jgi:RHS repeat-associated protein